MRRIFEHKRKSKNPIESKGEMVSGRNRKWTLKDVKMTEWVKAGCKYKERRVKTRRMEANSSAKPAPLPVHPTIQPLSYLLGTWRGQGEGGFPTINSFSYGEELLFSHSGKPVIAYSQKTWKLSSGEPMHAESGYWRPKPDGTIEVVIAQSTGLVEVQKGTYNAEEKLVKLQSELVGNASKVREISRVFELANGELSYVVEMATNLNSLQPHLKALLKKI